MEKIKLSVGCERESGAAMFQWKEPPATASHRVNAVLNQVAEHPPTHPVGDLWLGKASSFPAAPSMGLLAVVLKELRDSRGLTVRGQGRGSCHGPEELSSSLAQAKGPSHPQCWGKDAGHPVREGLSPPILFQKRPKWDDFGNSPPKPVSSSIP